MSKLYKKYVLLKINNPQKIYLYLKYCLSEISKFLEKEKLTLNKKSRIYKNTNNFIFLGRTPDGKYAKYRNLNRKLKHKDYLYRTGKIPLLNYVSSLISYDTVRKKVVINYFKNSTILFPCWFLLFSYFLYIFYCDIRF